MYIKDTKFLSVFTGFITILGVFSSRYPMRSLVAVATNSSEHLSATKTAAAYLIYCRNKSLTLPMLSVILCLHICLYDSQLLLCEISTLMHIHPLCLSSLQHCGKVSWLLFKLQGRHIHEHNCTGKTAAHTIFLTSIFSASNRWF